MGSSEDVIRIYNQGYDCAQCIVKAMEGKVEYDEATAMKSDRKSTRLNSSH